MSNNNLCILKSAHVNCLIFVGFGTQSLHEARIIISHIKLTSNLMILMHVKISSSRANSGILVVKKLLQKITS